MALTQKEKQELIRKARSGQTTQVIRPDIPTASSSVIKSQQAKSDIRGGITAIRQFQTELIANARAEQEKKKTPTISSFSSQRIQAPIEAGPQQIAKEANASSRDFLRKKTPIGKFFLGNSEAEYMGNVERPKSEDEGFLKGLGKDIQSRGVIRGLLYENVLKTPEERLFINLGELKKLGYESSEAERYARNFAAGDTKDIPEAAMSQLRSVENTRKAWAFVEMLDVIPFAKALKLKMSNSFFRETISTSIAAESAVEARRIITDAIPDLKGTKELEDLVTSIRQVSDPVEGENVLRAIADTSKRTAVESTEAQRVFYDNGIPIVRGGDVASETVRRGAINVPSQTKDALALRKEINDVIAGQAERSRLSNLNVFADEIKAGAIPFKASVDSPVKMFVADAIDDIKKLLPGDRLATAKEVLEETLEKGKAKAIEVMPKDLVRLTDGTFVYAPKESLEKGVQATMRGLRESQRAKVAKIERQKAVSQLRKEIANEADIFNQTLARREAQKAAKVAQEEKMSNARRVLEEQGERTRKLIESRVADREARISTIQAKAKETAKAVTEASKTLKTLESEAGKLPKLMAKERDKARKAIERVRNLKSLPPKERVKRITRIRKERDRNIARLAKDRQKLQAQAIKARAKLIEAKSKVVDKGSEIRKVRSEVKEQLRTLRADSKTAITEAKQVLKEAPTPVQKARIENTKQVDSLVESIKESFSITAKTIPDTVPSPIQPVKGEGKTVESQIIQGLQDEIEVIKKNFEERGLSLADLPDTHQAIGNSALMKQAFADLVADPAKVYSDFISGVLPEGTTRAAYALALMKSDFVLQNPARMDMVARSFFKGNTRIAQELQSIKVFGRMDYLNIVGRFSKQADDLLKARGVDVEKEATKLLKRFSDDFDDLPPISRAELKKNLDSITCKV